MTVLLATDSLRYTRSLNTVFCYQGVPQGGGVLAASLSIRRPSVEGAEVEGAKGKGGLDVSGVLGVRQHLKELGKQLAEKKEKREKAWKRR
eukprot:3468863-Rhodomonas_salina.1